MAIVITLKFDTDEADEIVNMFQMQLKALKNFTDIDGEIVEVSRVANPQEETE